MRITAGIYRGRPLASAPDRSIRPAMDRIRASIFNILQNRVRIQGARVLDLFAGTGSLGFEALSRGASECIFVDENRKALAIINENAGTLGCSGQCDIIGGSAVTAVRSLKGEFDLIFADPPYAFGETAGLPALIFGQGLVRPEGYLVIEHARRLVFDEHQDFTAVVRREYGNTTISMFTHPQPGKATP